LVLSPDIYPFLSGVFEVPPVLGWFPRPWPSHLPGGYYG